MPGCLCFRPRRSKAVEPQTAAASNARQPAGASRAAAELVPGPAALSASAPAPGPVPAHPSASTPPRVPEAAPQPETSTRAVTQPLEGPSTPEPAPAAHTASDAAAQAAGPSAQAACAELLQVEARLGSASSTSSAYYSAGGWSHFDDEGEWLGPPAGRTHSAESTSRRARTQGPSASGAPGGALASPMAADPPPGPHHGLHPLHQLPPPFHPLHPHAHAHAHAHASSGHGPHHAQPASAVPAAPQNGHAAAPGQAAPASAASPKSVASSVMVVAEASSRAVAMAPIEAEGLPAPPPATREALLDRVTELYAIQGRPCKACQVLVQYCKANDLKPDSLQPDLKARDMPDADGLAKVVQGVTDGLEDLASDEGWQLVRDDELRLLYKAVPKSNVHCFRARCVLDAPTEHLVALAREVDLCPTWNKYCTSAYVLKEASPTDVTVYMSLYVPWPFNDVGFVVEANGADLYEEEGRLIIAFASPDSKESGVQLPAGAEKHRKVKLQRPSCMSFTPLPPKTPGGPQRTLCHVQTYVNPGISVPAFIISFVLKVLSPFVYGAVQKVLASAFKSPTGPLPSRLQQREFLYGLVKRRTEAYLAQQQQQQQQQDHAQ